MISIDVNRLRLAPGLRVLDIGCGSGRHTAAIARSKGIQVLGADINPADVIETKKRLIFQERLEGKRGRWDLLAASINRLPFKDNFFDLIVCSEILEHIPDHRMAVAEVVRVLKPGRDLVVSVPRFWPERICWALSREYHNANNGHIRIYKKKELIKLLENSGLKKWSSHYAHSLHVPYWWLKCLLGSTRKDAVAVNLYHDLLTWDIMKRPWITRFLDHLLNPILGKSLVLYLKKAED
ncbi:MAG: class I SAM-dependent methyltransferase [Desulfobacterales bacterium]|nr:class I SAM-dependent methyltransferase [Desulfobacterales bacterium]